MRPESIPPLNVDEHRELSREIRLAGARLRELENLVTGVYGPNSRASFSFAKVVESVERLQDAMEEQAALDHPGVPVDGIYLANSRG